MLLAECSTSGADRIDRVGLALVRLAGRLGWPWSASAWEQVTARHNCAGHAFGRTGWDQASQRWARPTPAPPQTVQRHGSHPGASRTERHAAMPVPNPASDPPGPPPNTHSCIARGCSRVAVLAQAASTGTAVTTSGRGGVVRVIPLLARRPLGTAAAGRALPP